MSGAGWACVEAAAGLLEAREREIVLGDLTEGGCDVWRGLSDVLGLALRRHAELWTSWSPWAASVGLAWPASLFLMGNSVAVSGALLRLGHGAPVVPAVGRLVLLMILAWMAGYVTGTISRKTLWASALACVVPCCFCLALWPGSWLGALRLLVFVAPAFCGVWMGRRRERLALRWAVMAAAAAMLVPVMWEQGGGLYGVGVLWPAVYLVCTARRRDVPV